MSIKNRYEFMFYVECIDGNPNGDPDMGNSPRIDPEDYHGYITDVAVKRRIRNYIETAYQNKEGMDIIIRHSTNMNRMIAQAREKAGLEASANGKNDIWKARNAACEIYYDVRTFGAVLSTGPNAGQVRGPVQLTFGRSVDPIAPQDITITRMNSTDDFKDNTSKTAENYIKLEQSTAEDKLRTMGRKQFIPYGLYEVRGFISANLSEQTGFNDNDLSALFEAILNMYEHDRSASKGQMSVIAPLIIFRHIGTDSDAEQRTRQAKLGCASAQRLFDLVRIARKERVGYPRSYRDYDLKIDLASRPAGIDIGFKCEPFGEILWNSVPDGQWIND